MTAGRAKIMLCFLAMEKQIMMNPLLQLLDNYKAITGLVL
jgi:hypothetical protein